MSGVERDGVDLDWLMEEMLFAWARAGRSIEEWRDVRNELYDTVDAQQFFEVMALHFRFEVMP